MGREAEPSGDPLDSSTPFPTLSGLSHSAALGALGPHQSHRDETAGRRGGGWRQRNTLRAPVPLPTPTHGAPDPGSLEAGALLGQAAHLGWCDCRRQRPPGGWCPPAATPRSAFASFHSPVAQRAGNSPPRTRGSDLHSLLGGKATLSPASNCSLCAPPQSRVSFSETLAARST